MSKKRTVLVTVLSIIILVVVGFFIYQQIEKRRAPVEATWEYKLEYIDPNLWESTDAKIVKINSATNEKEVLIESIKEVLPELKEEPRYTLYKISYSEILSKIFFIQSPTTGVTPCRVLSFNINSKEFKEMEISKYFCKYEMCGYYCGWGVFVSSNKKMILMPSKDKSEEGKGLSQALHLLDLEKDEIRTLVNLSNNETLNKNFGSDYSSFDIKWLNDKTIQYSVYDQSQSVSAVTDKPLIEIRKIEL